MSIHVDANLFRLAYMAVSTEETRYYLNGVHIEAHPEKGALLVSTDGHRMIVIHDTTGVCGDSVIVKLPRFVLAQCRLPKMFTTKRVLEIDPAGKGAATLVDIIPGKKPVDEPTREAVVTAHGVVIDGTFPDWRRVVPSSATPPSNPAATAFNPKYLRQWGDLGQEIARSPGADGGDMQIALSDGGSPVFVRFGGVDNIFGIQMPMRSSVTGSALPAFMKQPEFRQAAE